MSEELELRRGLKRALRLDDAGLAQALGELRGEEIRSGSDAELVVKVLERMPLKGAPEPKGRSCLGIVVGWLLSTESRAAHRVTERAAVPHLMRLFDVYIGGAGEDIERLRDLQFLVRLLALCEAKGGERCFVQVARVHHKRAHELWPTVFEPLKLEEPHPWGVAVIKGLENPLPDGTLGLMLLELANQLCALGVLDEHPFAFDAAVERLARLLGDTREIALRHAKAACCALPFLPAAYRKQLIEIADEHPSPAVELEAAWALARSGKRSGMARLRDIGADPRYALAVKRYLEEIDAPAEYMPEKLQNKTFVAKATMCEWLAHPKEFGSPPTRIRKLDSRRLYWPPLDEIRRVYLFIYEYPPPGDRTEPRIGAGMVGGAMTFSLFRDRVTDSLTPKMLYAQHCLFELNAMDDPRLDKNNMKGGLQILGDYNEGFDD
ncbi:MAG: hypothetical protein AB7K71_11605 [Polyangiaceae bacterium]